MTAPPGVVRHPKYYFENGSYIFLVENTLYKLQHTILTTESVVFAQLFEIGSIGPPKTEGKSDENPILLERYTVQSFDLLIEFKYSCPRQAADYSSEDLKRFLELICMLQCSNAIRDYITTCILQRPFIFHPSELIYFGTEYDIPPLLACGFTRLCEIPLIKIKKRHCLLMTSEVFAAYIQVKTRLDKHRRMVAGEPPEMQHSNDCQDLVACSEDWRAVWWNGMGRLLLDARNPHSYDDTLERFKSLRFGRVTEACKLYMFDNVIDTDLPAYHSRIFVTRIKNDLVQKLFPHTE